MSDDKRSGGDGRKPPRGGKKPFGPKKTFGAGEGFRRRGTDGDAPPRRSFRDRDEGGETRQRREDRPARSFADRNQGERPQRKPFRAGEGSERPFRQNRLDERKSGDFRPRRFDDRQDRPFRERSRDEGETSRGGFRPRTDAQRDDRPQRRDDRFGRGERPSRDGDRPFKPRRFDTSFEPREGGRSSFEPRFENRREERPEKDRARRPEVRSERKADTAKVTTAPAADTGTGEFAGDRIAKVIARAGLGSRRDVEAWIEEGRVSVNGEVLTSAARNVTDADKIVVDGKLLPRRERTRLWLYHKPRGLVTTEKDPEGRPTVFENLDPSLPRVMSIGRLDINTEGLLLLTNDGGLARQLELPKTGWLRRYRVRAFGETDQVQLDKLFEGLTVDGVDYGRIEAKLDKEQGANSWLTLGLREGKNREVKNVLSSIGLDVNRLIRVSYGPFQLGDLAEGKVEEIKTRVLIDQLGADLIAEAECEFEAPVFERGAEEPVSPAGKFGAGKPARGGPRRGMRVTSEEGGERLMRGGLIEDRHGRRVLVQRVADIPEEKPAKRGKPFRTRGNEFSFGPRPSFKDRGREGDDDRGFKSRPSFRNRDEGGERPRPSFRDRDQSGGERPFKPRPAFRDRDEGGDRPRSGFRGRSDEGGERPFKPRPSFRDRDEGGSRPRPSFRDREQNGGERPFKSRPAFRDREEGGDRPRPGFRGRNEEASDRPFRPRPSFRDRDEGGDRPFKPRFGGKPGGGKPGGGRPFAGGKGGPRGPRGPRRGS